MLICIAFKLFVPHLEYRKCYASKENAAQVKTKYKNPYADNSRLDFGGVPIKLQMAEDS